VAAEKWTRQRPIVQTVKISGNFRHYPSWLFTPNLIAQSADFVGPILPILGTVFRYFSSLHLEL
jgi:hypothetical protein